MCRLFTAIILLVICLGGLIFSFTLHSFIIKPSSSATSTILSFAEHLSFFDSIATHSITQPPPQILFAFTATAVPPSKHIDITAPWGTIPMPPTSYFTGFDPPTNASRWNHAQYQASTGEQVLLAQVLKAIKSPFDLIKADHDYKWIHRLADLQINAFDTIVHYKGHRAPIVQLGYRQFAYGNFEGKLITAEELSTKYILNKLQTGQSLSIPRTFIGLGFMEEDAGWLSTYFLNRTTSTKTFQYGRSSFPQEIKPFLDSPELLMLLVNQHHNVSDHPKILSLPLGVKAPRALWTLLSRSIRKNIAKSIELTALGSEGGIAPLIRTCVEENTHEMLRVTPIKKNRKELYSSLMSSRMVLALPGAGYDTYVIWEALALGAMPVLEKGIGLDRTVYRLPVLLVEDYADVTPALLRQAYVEALYHADEWEFERITHAWYERLLFEVAESGSMEPLLELHPMSAVDINFTRPLVPFNCALMGGCGPGTKRTPKRSCAIDPSIVDSSYRWNWSDGTKRGKHQAA